jgi:hypothetical protein
MMDNNVSKGLPLSASMIEDRVGGEQEAFFLPEDGDGRIV